jgi:3-methylcrotonyl-CoA carboxylase alpha subunit
MFKKVLVANRGEIAVRVMRACRELGLPSVAVYSEADRAALHVRLADEAVQIGPAPAAQSYLLIEKILEAARKTGADAIHPGYGFLSENPDFARETAAAGFTFIGPPADAIAAMGDKAQARSRAIRAGVPVVPGYQGPDDQHSLQAASVEIGYPLLIKASAGGGGKGMRIVWQPEQLIEGINAARREAGHAFGDDRLLVEKYINRAHHVEIQVLGDQYGHILHLFERECSIQRRHQKIIEETPSPLISPELRAEMCASAVAAAAAVGYQNAGTVEFIVDPDTLQYYFLEMNTRLQVEHPITETVTGFDLVQWQIRIATGEELSLSQDQLSQRGHAIECRLYAEDPANSFLPSAGKLLRFIEPAGPGIRVDSGFTSGDEITTHYDPLIAKLVVHAEDRPAAIRRMRGALCETVILGITTNVQFLQDVLDHPDFSTGRAHTTWVEEHFADWSPPSCPFPLEAVVGAALSQTHQTPGYQSSPLEPRLQKDPFSPWRTSSSFRLGEK